MKTIKLKEAIEILTPKAFSATIKPVSWHCNLRCTYCYYLDKEKIYSDSYKIMSHEILEECIKQYLDCNNSSSVCFTWHGGEPLLAGIDFFKKAVELERVHNRQNKKIENSIQTNGTLLTEEWCRFFKSNGFLVGVSIDGPKSVHDTYRLSRGRLSAFEKTIVGIELLKKFEVDFNTLSVVSRASEGRGKEIYNYLKSIGSGYMQFLPAADYVYSNGCGEPAAWSVSAEGYGRFLTDIFDEWIVRDVGEVFVQLFDLTLAAFAGMEATVCAYRGRCGENIAIEHNGDIFSCDHFVYPKYKIGNICKEGLNAALVSAEHVRFGLNKSYTLSKECLRCEYLFACRGECPKHRHLILDDGEKKFLLCEGIKMFYKHSAPYMESMARQLIG